MKNFIRTNFYSFLLSVFAVVLVACGEKTPPAPIANCESPLAKTAVSEVLAKKFVDEGLKGYGVHEVANLLTVSDTVAINKEGDYYKCNGKVSVKFSPELGEKIGNAFVTLKGRKELQEKLELKFGPLYGPTMFNQLNGALSDGPYGVIPEFPTSEQLKILTDTLKKNADSIVSGDTKISVTYEIIPNKSADGKSLMDYNAYVNDLERFDLDLVILSLMSVL